MRNTSDDVGNIMTATIHLRDCMKNIIDIVDMLNEQGEVHPNFSIQALKENFRDLDNATDKF